MAKTISLSPSRFQHLFKKIMNESPMNYLKRIRIRHAQSMLLQTDNPVYEIATKSGYNDPFHFSRAFKSFCGLSPAAFRNQTLHPQKQKATAI